MFAGVLSKLEGWLNFGSKKENQSLPEPCASKLFFDVSRSPEAPLLTAEEADELAQSMRRRLRADTTPSAATARRTELAEQVLRFGWRQRLKIPSLELHTMSDHKRLQMSNPGWLNTLGDRLTPEEEEGLIPLVQ